MKFIFDLTCPATVQTPAYNGHVALHRSVQWIDPDTITQCDLVHTHGLKEPTRLDMDQSVITVKDYDADGNTFKVMGQLMADPVTFEHIKSRGIVFFHAGFGLSDIFGFSTLFDTSVFVQIY